MDPLGTMWVHCWVQHSTSPPAVLTWVSSSPRLLPQRASTLVWWDCNTGVAVQGTVQGAAQGVACVVRQYQPLTHPPTQIHIYNVCVSAGCSLRLWESSRPEPTCAVWSSGMQRVLSPGSTLHWRRRCRRPAPGEWHQRPPTLAPLDPQPPQALRRAAHPRCVATTLCSQRCS